MLLGVHNLCFFNFFFGGGGAAVRKSLPPLRARQFSTHIIVIIIIISVIIVFIKIIIIIIISISISIIITFYAGHCATSRKVAGSTPDGVIEIFH